MFNKGKLFLKELYKAAYDIYCTLISKTNLDEAYYLSQLSKCCHILDKGLYTVPFVKGHSIRVYNDAKKIAGIIVSDKYVNDPCFLWCKERINRYEQRQQSSSEESSKYCSVVKYEHPQIYFDFINSATSVRRFNEKEVANEIIEKCISTAQSTASSCFRQTTRCYAIKNKNVIEKLTPNIAGLTGFSNGVPLLFCITSDMRPYDCVERNLCYIDASLYSQSLVLALRSNNIFSVFLNFLLASKSDIINVKNLLQIPDYEKIIIFIACGYSDFVSEKPVRVQTDKMSKIIE